MSTYRDFPNTTSDRLQEYESMKPTDTFLDDSTKAAKKWLNSAALRDKATKALRYAEKHPQRVMLASLARCPPRSSRSLASTCPDSWTSSPQSL